MDNKEINFINLIIDANERINRDGELFTESATDPVSPEDILNSELRGMFRFLGGFNEENFMIISGTITSLIEAVRSKKNIEHFGPITRNVLSLSLVVTKPQKKYMW